MKKEDIKLKPCPFCGMVPNMELDADDILHPSGIHWRDTGRGYYEYSRRSEAKPDSQPCWEMSCLEVAGGCGAEIFGHSMEETVEKWNRREGEKELAEVLRFMYDNAHYDNDENLFMGCCLTDAQYEWLESIAIKYTEEE